MFPSASNSFLKNWISLNLTGLKTSLFWLFLLTVFFFLIKNIPTLLLITFVDKFIGISHSSWPEVPLRSHSHSFSSKINSYFLVFEFILYPVNTTVKLSSISLSSEFLSLSYFKTYFSPSLNSLILNLLSYIPLFIFFLLFSFFC